MPDSECGSKEGFPEEEPFCCKLKGVSVWGKKSLGTRILRINNKIKAERGKQTSESVVSDPSKCQKGQQHPRPHSERCYLFSLAGVRSMGLLGGWPLIRRP